MHLVTLTGTVVSGRGKAHIHCAQHDPYFNCRMIGTLNVKLDRPFLGAAVVRPAKTGSLNPPPYECEKSYWLAKVRGGGQEAYAWIFRWQGSTMPKNKIELLSRRPLPDAFKTNPLEITVYEGADEDTVREWVKGKYWFQTFPWSPPKADSARVWNTISKGQTFSNTDVLDIGSHYGFHSFQAAKAGANVLGVEVDDECLQMAVTINNHIEQQDVTFTRTEPTNAMFDFIFYLSVHHQIDPTYDGLYERIRALRASCDTLFVELILPSCGLGFGGGRTDAQVDEIVGGKVLDTYKHNIRGVRRIYEVLGPSR